MNVASSRRAARLRREYLYRKSLEGEARAEYEKKQQLKAALQAGRPIPTELRRDVGKLKEGVELDDERTAGKPKSHIDDEYAAAAVRAPKVCVTTSRDPSSRLKAFAAEVRLIFPGAQRLNRGNTTIKEIVDACRDADFTDVVVLGETRGEPDTLIVSHLPFGPTVSFSLSNAVLRHDIEDRGTVSEAAPHLIFHNLRTPLGARIQTVLTHLFPAPKPDSARVMTFANDSDYIAFRHHVYERAEGAPAGPDAPLGKKDIVLKEVGPRFDLHPFQIRLGTVDQTEAELEWVLRPYMNTARKRQAL